MGDAIKKAGNTFLGTYREVKRDQDEERARAFYERLQTEQLDMAREQNAREAAAAGRQEKLFGMQEKEWDFKLKEMSEKAGAAEEFLKKNGVSFEAWKLLTEEEKYQRALAAEDMAREASAATRNLANFRLGQEQKEAPLQLRILSGNADRSEFEAEKAGNEARISTAVYPEALKAKFAEAEKGLLELENFKLVMEDNKRKGDYAAKVQGLSEITTEADSAIDRFTKLTGSMAQLTDSSGNFIVPGLEVPMSQALADVSNQMNATLKKASALMGSTFNLEVDAKQPDAGASFMRKEVEKLRYKGSQEKKDMAAAEAAKPVWYVVDDEEKLKEVRDEKELMVWLSKDPERVLDPDKVHGRFVGRKYPLRRSSPVTPGLLGPGRKYLLPAELQELDNQVSVR